MRIDKFLAERGYTRSRESAQTLLRAGSVSVAGKIIPKPSFEIDELNPPEIILSDSMKYVSRGGLKLEHALDTFAIAVTGCDAVDIGASTGGFTDCLLQRGAASVCAVDVGRSQLDPSLAADRRVTSYEGLNARTLTSEAIGGPFDVAVCDVSFISLTLLFPAIRGILKPDGILVALIKPQFEAGRAHLGKNGIVRDRTVHTDVIARVLSCAASEGLAGRALCASPIAGGDGNREYLAVFNGRAKTREVKTCDAKNRTAETRAVQTGAEGISSEDIRRVVFGH